MPSQVWSGWWMALYAPRAMTDGPESKDAVSPLPAQSRDEARWPYLLVRPG